MSVGVTSSFVDVTAVMHASYLPDRNCLSAVAAQLSPLAGVIGVICGVSCRPYFRQRPRPQGAYLLCYLTHKRVACSPLITPCQILSNQGLHALCTLFFRKIITKQNTKCNTRRIFLSTIMTASFGVNKSLGGTFGSSYGGLKVSTA